MTKRLPMAALVVPATLVFLLGTTITASLAQVEPRLVGTWQMETESGQPPKELRVDSSGRYETLSGGKVIESGKVVLNDGNCKLQSSSGQSESGRYSVIGGKLHFYNGALAGEWSGGSPKLPGKAPASFSSSPPALTGTSPSARPDTSALYSSSPPTLRGSAAAAAKALDQAARGSFPDKIPFSPSSLPSLKSNFSPSSLPPGKSSYSSPSSLPSGKSNYSSTSTGPTIQYTESGVEVRTVRPGAYISPTWRRQMGKLTNQRKEWSPEQNHLTTGASPENGGSVTSTTGSTTAGEYQYPKEQKKFDFNTWAAVQQMNRGQQGLQSVPKGGYIPVMKDGKARRFFQGR